jgi:hypothetical protein
VRAEFVDDRAGGYDYIMAADVIGFPAVLDILATTLHTLMFSPSVSVRLTGLTAVRRYAHSNGCGGREPRAV